MLGVHRPGYLPQEGHRLTQFLDPGHTRSRASSLTSLRASLSLRYPRVGSKNVNYASGARIKSNKNVITATPFIARGIKTDSK